MATRLQQIVSQAVAAGATVAISHSLNVNGVAVIPDYISRDNMGFTGVGATSSTVTVRNDTGALATITLRLRYYHTIDRVYGNAATLQLSPAPFWDGGAAAIMGAGAFTEFVYQPGGTATGPLVFASFPTLYAAMVAARVAGGGNIPIILGYDTSLGAVTVPAGTYDLTNVTEVGVGNGAPVAVAYADGTVFTGQRRWRNLIVTNLNTTTPPNTDAADGAMFFLDRTVLSTTTGINIPLIRFGVAGTFTAWLENGSAFGGGTSLGGTQTGRVVGITGVAAKHFQIVLDASSQLVESTLVGGAAADLVIEAPSAAQIPVVAGWTSAATNPVVLAPASYQPVPYLGVPSAGAVTLTHGAYARVDGTGGVTQPLPAIGAATAGHTGAGVATFIANTSTTGSITVTPNGADTIQDSLGTYRIPPQVTMVFISDGVGNWRVLGAGQAPLVSPLRNPGWGAGTMGSAIANDAARASHHGTAWRDFPAGEPFVAAAELLVSGVGITWAEIAIGTSPTYVAGTDPVITVVGWASVAADLAAAPAAIVPIVGLTNAILAGEQVWIIWACTNTTSDPQLLADRADTTSSGLIGILTTAGWRPSLNVGVPTTWARDTLAGPIRTSVSTSSGS